MRALALLALLAAVVAGCGATDRVAADRVAAAAERTAETGSARIELRVGGDERFTLSGAVDFEAREAQLTFSGAGGGETAEGELRLVDDTLYVRAPLLGLLSGEQDWLAAPLPQEGRDGGAPDNLVPVPYVDPNELLSAVRDAGGEASRLGEQEIRGVAAEGYRLELDVARLFARGLQSGTRETTVPVEIWIDDADRVRRVDVAHEGKGATVDFFDFGADVDVQPPPPDEVLDLTSILDIIREGDD